MSEFRGQACNRITGRPEPPLSEYAMSTPPEFTVGMMQPRIQGAAMGSCGAAGLRYLRCGGLLDGQAVPSPSRLTTSRRWLSRAMVGQGTVIAKVVPLDDDARSILPPMAATSWLTT
jgi:hypothetical protein